VGLLAEVSARFLVPTQEAFRRRRKRNISSPKPRNGTRRPWGNLGLMNQLATINWKMQSCKR